MSPASVGFALARARWARGDRDAARRGANEARATADEVPGLSAEMDAWIAARR